MGRSTRGKKKAVTIDKSGVRRKVKLLLEGGSEAFGEDRLCRQRLGGKKGNIFFS